MSAVVKKLETYIPISEIFDQWYNNPNVAFLDSSKEDELGQYSIIGISPYLEVEEREGILYINGKEKTGSMESYLKEYLRENQQKNSTQLPIISGAIGFFSYDYGRRFEQIGTRHSLQSSIPEARFVFYDNFIVEDKTKKEVYLVANGKTKEAKESIAELEGFITNIGKDKKEILLFNDAKETIELQKSVTKEQYLEALEKVRDYIRKGHIYVMNLTQQIQIQSKRSPYEVFKRLQRNNPAPFSAYLNYGEYEIISASPERFLKVKDGKIETRPIKGTRKRGNTKEEDDALKKELAHSQKDKSELLMIVDLERNDLNRICIPGSVKVTELFQVETYETVFHLVSNVVGELQKNIDMIDVLNAMFPGGSITGAPKVRAMEIIDELEVQRRGIYTGILGYLSLNGDCDFNIVIRTALYQNEQYRIGVGGGITYESDMEFEYEETLQKAKALIEAISM